MNRALQIVLLVLIFFIAGCRNADKDKRIHTIRHEVISEPVHLQFAKGFSIDLVPEGKRIKVFNPWQGASNITFGYLLVSDKRKLNDLAPGEIVIPTPVHRVICLSTTHIALISFVE